MSERELNLISTIFKGNNIPIFYAIEPGCEIKTTLLRELDGYCNTKVVQHTKLGGGGGGINISYGKAKEQPIQW